MTTEILLGLTLLAEVLLERPERLVEVIEQVSNRVLNLLVRQRASSLLLLHLGSGRRRVVLDRRDEGRRRVAEGVANVGIQFPTDLVEVASDALEVDVKVVRRLDETLERVEREVVANERQHLSTLSEIAFEGRRGDRDSRHRPWSSSCRSRLA